MAKNITIQTGQIHGYHGSDAAPELRWFVKKNFEAFDGNVVQHSPLDIGEFYDKAVCTVGVTGIVTYPQFTIYDTESALSDPDLTTYTFALFDSSGGLIGIVLRNIRIPASPTSTSLAALAIYSGATTPVVDPAETYTKLEVDARIAAQMTGLVLITDPVWNAVVDKKYATEYADIDAAIADIGASPAELVVSVASTPLTNTGAIPATCRLTFEGPGSIAIPAGKTLTVNLMTDPGNKQVFEQADATANVLFGVGAVEKMNVAWFVGPTGTSITNAINQIMASMTANGKGHLYIPGGDWTAAGGYDVPSNCRVSGDGIDNTVLKFSAGSTYMFKNGNGVHELDVEHFTLDGNGQTNTTGILFEVPDAGGSAGIAVMRSVKLTDLATSVSLHSTGGTSGQVAHILIDRGCYIQNCDVGVYSNSVNSGLRCDAFFELSSSQKAFQIDAIGELTVSGEWAGRTWTGRAQVLKQTLTGAVSADGNLTVTIEAAAMNSGTPEVILVPVTAGLTLSQAMQLVRTAIANTPNTASFFHVAGAGADATIIPIDAVANDATMAFTIDGAATGVTNVSGTAATTLSTGVADSTQPQGVIIDGPVAIGANFIDFQEEGFKDLIVVNYDNEQTAINFFGSLIEDPIRMIGNCVVNLYGGKIYDRAVRDGANDGTLNNFGAFVIDYYYNSDATVYTLDRTNKSVHNFGAQTCIVGFDMAQSKDKIFSQYMLRLLHNTAVAGDTGPQLQLGSSLPGGANKVALWVGKTDEMGNRLYGYDILWDGVTNPGHLTFEGNQTGFLGYNFNAGLYAEGMLANLPYIGIGYEAGAGGAVTQGTSRTTAVTCDFLSGDITLFTAAGSATAASFTVNNSRALATDRIIVNQKSGTNKYLPFVTAKADGSFEITFFTTGGTASDAPVFSFLILRGAIT